MVSDGWVLFEKTAEETAPGELRQHPAITEDEYHTTGYTDYPNKSEERGGGGGNGTGAWHVKDCGNTNLCQAGG